MTARRFLQLDVFAARPGAGNPLAVIPDAEGLDDATMQAIAAGQGKQTILVPANMLEAFGDAFKMLKGRP